MRPRVFTPYYLDNKRAQRFHTQQAMSGISSAIGGGALAYAGAHGAHRMHPALRGMSNHTARNIGIGVAGASVAYTGYHALRAKQFKNQRRSMDARVNKAGSRGR